MKRNLAIFSGVVLFSCFCNPASATVFFQNTADLGNAYNGGAALAEDASTEYSNPAGLVRLTQQQLSASVIAVMPQIDFHGTAASVFTAPETGHAQSNMLVPLPTFQYAYPLNDRLVFGIGLVEPIGLGSSYTKASVLRYTCVQTAAGVADLSPGLGFKITDKFSGGLGLDVQYAQLTLSSMQPVPGFQDGYSESHGHDVGLGWHAGILYQFNCQSRVGLSYFSQVVHHPGDYSQFTDPSFPTSYTSYFKTAITLPPSTMASFYQGLGSRWALMGTVKYMQWGVIRQVLLHNVAQPGGITIDGPVPANFRNTWEGGLGLNYRLNPCWLLRTGFIVTEGFVTTGNRSPSVPDITNFSLAVGAHYDHSKCLGFDIGYMRYFLPRANIRLRTALNNVDGYTNTVVDVVGAQLTWKI